MLPPGLLLPSHLARGTLSPRNADDSQKRLRGGEGSGQKSRPPPLGLCNFGQINLPQDAQLPTDGGNMSHRDES